MDSQWTKNGFLRLSFVLCLRELPSDGLAHLAHLDEVDAVFTIAVTPRLVSDVATPPRVGPTARPPRVTVEIRVAFTVRRAIRGHKIGPAPQVGPNPPAEVQGVEKRELDGPVVVVLLMFCDSVVDGAFQRGQFFGEVHNMGRNVLDLQYISLSGNGFVTGQHEGWARTCCLQKHKGESPND
eukprot:m.69614 g.69614  ORF g.69614 m.69614 type:complete len:182 (-) comp9974_c0_seq2:367-912(-)